MTEGEQYWPTTTSFEHDSAAVAVVAFEFLPETNNGSPVGSLSACKIAFYLG